MSTVFRQQVAPTEPKAEEPRDESGTTIEVEGLKPVESDQDILEALDIGYDVKSLPEEDREGFEELKSYLRGVLEEKGLSPTQEGYKRAVEIIKEDFGLDKKADPQTVLQRVVSISKSYRSLSFIKSLDERKQILVKLISANSSEEMDRIIFKEMEARKVWQ